ncbi:helix-turn-helix domain-containing protein [Streptomyces cahuitamycinicus]|uniref:helix-turn-helix domain-containing protein n=1 Tax=Streptomyces cahuitamycinicus TaxID=2070367 RepID=UPI001FED2187|nr:helix-turn-helix domain-containing protein [Streptomyces cahuitamycinicus]
MPGATVDHRKPVGQERPPAHPRVPDQADQVVRVVEPMTHLTAAPLRDQPDWSAPQDTVTAWCESGFSLVRASAALHIHRNSSPAVRRGSTGRPLRCTWPV